MKGYRDYFLSHKERLHDRCEGHESRMTDVIFLTPTIFRLLKLFISLPYQLKVARIQATQVKKSRYGTAKAAEKDKQSVTCSMIPVIFICTNIKYSPGAFQISPRPCLLCIYERIDSQSVRWKQRILPTLQYGGAELYFSSIITVSREKNRRKKLERNNRAMEKQ